MWFRHMFTSHCRTAWSSRWRTACQWRTARRLHSQLLAATQIVLPHAFVHGDGLGVRYVSQQYTDKEVLNEQSCLELLCYLVVSAPARVRLHPSCFIGGWQKVQEFQMKAVEFRNSIGFDGPEEEPELHRPCCGPRL